MPRKTKLSATEHTVIRNGVERSKSKRSIAKSLGVSPGTITRALARITNKTRKADEFSGAMSASVSPPRKSRGTFAWSLEAIRQARDAQLRGDFAQPVRLAEAMRTDDALFVAYHNRIAPQSAVRATLTPCEGTRGANLARKAAASITTPRSVLEGLHGTLANHGIAIGYVEHEANEEGTRIDMRLTEWPLEHAKYNDSTEQLETRVKDGAAMVPITHGDGHWIVFRKFGVLPWTQEACILPGALVWAAHAEGIKDWAAGSASHGQAKIVGELPEGVSLQAAEGVLSPQALAFLSMLQDMVSGEAGAGIRPAGSKTDFLANGSTAWQVFKELITNREKAAARIYLGTDAILGSVGGAPGVDIAQLFGVATTKIQGDFLALEEGLYSGLYVPWTAINEGESRYAPRLKYEMPDVDAAANSLEESSKLERLFDAIERMKSAQMIVDQSTIDRLAKLFGVTEIPQLAAAETASITIQLAPTDVARVVRVIEARRSQGLPPLGDERDQWFISELETKSAAGVAQVPAATGVLTKLSEEVEYLAQGGRDPIDPSSSSFIVELDFDESKHPRADDGKFGSGGGSGGTPDAKKEARTKDQTDFDKSAGFANSVAAKTGLGDNLRDFLNKDRARVSKAEWSGEPNETSDKVNSFLHTARAQGADYKGKVFRGTTAAELDHLTSHGTNKRTWSVSKDPEGSANFAKKGGVLLVIDKNSGAVPVDGIEGSHTFNEALLPKNTKFKITNRRKVNGVEVVNIQAVHS